MESGPFYGANTNLPMRRQFYHYILLLAFGTIVIGKLAVLTNHLRCHDGSNLQTSSAIVNTLALVTALASASVVAADVKKYDGVTLWILCNVNSKFLESSSREVATRIPGVQSATVILAQIALVALIISAPVPTTLSVPHIPSSMLDIMAKMGAVPHTHFVLHVLWRALCFAGIRQIYFHMPARWAAHWVCGCPILIAPT